LSSWWPEDQLEVWRGWQRQWRNSHRQFVESINAIGESSRLNLLAQMQTFGPIIEAASHARDAIAAAWKEAMPANWHGFEVGDVTAAIDTATASGINLVWVPRADIVRAVCAAEHDADREAVLVDHRSEIVGDLDDVIAQVTLPSLGHLSRMARQAIAACRDGHFAAAQSHAAAALSGVVHDVFGHKRFSDARAAFSKDDPDDVALSTLRLCVLRQVFARALEHTNYAEPGFNRNASLHGAFPDQHTDANALAALLLLVGVLREVQAFLEAQEQIEAAARTRSGDSTVAE
jgi:hypothetical protein